jgi:L-rhamnose mutarotase
MVLVRLLPATYWEYHGKDWAGNAKKMAADVRTQDWWAIHDPMQAPLETRKAGECWAMAEEVFHHD